MRDLEVAKQILMDKDLSLVIVKEGKILFESHSSGISSLLQAVEKLKGNANGSSVADKIVGRATALLFVYLHVKEVYAVTMSSEGLKVLKENGIPAEYGSSVPKILNKEGKDMCPFERFSLTIKTVDEAYEKLKVFTGDLRKAK